MSPTIPSGRLNTTKKAVSHDTAFWREFGAADRNRTGDLLITNQLLYRLSYSSEGAHSKATQQIPQLSGYFTATRLRIITPTLSSDGPTRPHYFPTHLQAVVFRNRTLHATNMRENRGFTLVELMVALAVLAILVSLAVPSMRDMILRNRVATTTNVLVSATALARSEAVMRSVPVMVCNSSNPDSSTPTCSTGSSWADGSIVFVDTNGNNKHEQDGTEEVLRTFAGVPQNINLTPNAPNARGVVFNRSGQASGVNSSSAATSGAVFVICADGLAQGRETTLGATGRASTGKKTCP
jgi:type IV fimbrial biogenesis protein FimT